MPLFLNCQRHFDKTRHSNYNLLSSQGQKFKNFKNFVNSTPNITSTVQMRRDSHTHRNLTNIHTLQMIVKYKIWDFFDKSSSILSKKS